MKTGRIRPVAEAGRVAAFGLASGPRRGDTASSGEAVRVEDPFAPELDSRTCGESDPTKSATKSSARGYSGISNSMGDMPCPSAY